MRMIGIVIAVLFVVSGCSQPTWLEFSPEDEQFKVMLPGTPTEETKTDVTKLGNVEVHTFGLELADDDIQFELKYHVYPPTFIGLFSPEQILDLRRGQLEYQLKAKLAGEHQWLTLDEIPGQEFRVSLADDKTLSVRTYLVGDRVYQLSVTTPDGEETRPEVSRFLESFELVY